MPSSSSWKSASKPAAAVNGTIVDGGTLDLSQPFYFNACSQDGATTITEVKVVSMAEPEPVRIVGGVTMLSNHVMKLVISGATPSDCPASTANLVDGAWGRIPHSDDAVNPYIVTNLTYSTTDGTNQFIYLQSNGTREFIRIQSVD